MATGWLWEERYAWYDAMTWNDFASTPAKSYVQPQEAFENPETKRRFRNLLDVSGLLDQLVPLRARPASDEEILRVHTPAHLARVRAVAATGGEPAMARRWAASATRSRCSPRAARSSRSTPCSTAPSTTPTRSSGRPATTPSPTAADGLLRLRNVAIASRHARGVRGVGRVAVVDWDVHHGNGTETAFYADPDVLTISLHQDEHYPAGPRPRRRRRRGRRRGAQPQHPAPARPRDRRLRRCLRARRRARPARASGPS